MRFGSVCSGIEAASVAWEPLGWECAWVSEIDGAARAVLAARYPDVPNHGDLLDLPWLVGEGLVEAPDILVGGTPCQAWSISGARESLDDPRGQLTLAFVKLINTIDEVRKRDGQPPVIVVWENVPGVLSTKDNAFGHFLAGLAGEDEPLQPPGKSWTNAGLVCGPERTICWRILDAQYTGLAQRRNRVFLVASPADHCDSGEILFESESVRRDIAPSREAREDVTHDIASCLRASGVGLDRIGDTRGQDPVVAVEGFCQLSISEYTSDNVASTRMARDLIVNGQQDPAHGEVCGPLDTDGGTNVYLQHAQAVSENQRAEVRLQDTCQSLTLGGGKPGQGYPAALCFSSKDYGGDVANEVSPTIRAGGHTGSHANGGVPPAALVNARVRRLLPVECERLQGFPDDWTLVTWNGKPMSDSSRYKLLGNSMAVNCMSWIGTRIQKEMDI